MGRIINGYYEFDDNGYNRFGKVKDFCYCRHLIEKVAVGVIVNQKEFLESGGSNIVEEEKVFNHPNIPSAFKTHISSLDFDSKDYQCD